MNQACRKHRARRADRMAMRNRTAFNVDDVVREPELLRNSERHSSECLVDLHTLDVRELPACSLQRDMYGRHRAEAEHAWLDERTLARVRRDRPELNGRALIRAYLRHVADQSFAGSCLFHGAAGCTLDPALRADLCFSYYCDGLKTFLRQVAADGTRPVVIRAARPD